MLHKDWIQGSLLGAVPNTSHWGRPQGRPRTCWRDGACQVGASWNHPEKSGCIYGVKEVRALLLRLPPQLSQISGWRWDAMIFTLRDGSTDRSDRNRPQLSLFLKNTIPWQHGKKWVSSRPAHRDCYIMGFYRPGSTSSLWRSAESTEEAELVISVAGVTFFFKGWLVHKYCQTVLTWY